MAMLEAAEAGVGSRTGEGPLGLRRSASRHGLGGFGGKTHVSEVAADLGGIGEGGDNLHAAGAARAGLDVDLEHPSKELGPGDTRWSGHGRCLVGGVGGGARVVFTRRGHLLGSGDQRAHGVVHPGVRGEAAEVPDPMSPRWGHEGDELAQELHRLEDELGCPGRRPGTFERSAFSTNAG